MIPFPSPSSFIAGISYILTFVATLRAGSRAKYLFQHGGILGKVEGPLLLPESDLFDAAFGFEAAVKFSSSDEFFLNTSKEQKNLDAESSSLVALKTKPSINSKLMVPMNLISSKTKSVLDAIFFQDEETNEATFYSLSPYTNYKENSLENEEPESLLNITSDSASALQLQNNSLNQNKTIIKRIRSTVSFRPLSRRNIRNTSSRPWPRHMLKLSTIRKSLVNTFKLPSFGFIRPNRPWKREHSWRIRQKKIETIDYSPGELVGSFIAFSYVFSFFMFFLFVFHLSLEPFILLSLSFHRNIRTTGFLESCIKLCKYSNKLQ